MPKSGVNNQKKPTIFEYGSNKLYYSPMLNEAKLLLDKPIPEGSGIVDGWKDKPIKESTEPVVPIGLWSSYPDIFTSSIYAGEFNSSPYFGNPFDGSLITVFTRKTVADALRKTQSLLPKDLYLVVHDAYRPKAVQANLYKNFDAENRQKHPTWTENRYYSNFSSIG